VAEEMEGGLKRRDPQPREDDDEGDSVGQGLIYIARVGAILVLGVVLVVALIGGCAYWLLTH